MKTLTKENQEILKMLNGYEIESLNYEGVVAVEQTMSGKYGVWVDGRIVDHLDTNKKVSKLWKEYMFTEGQYC
jgi:hypothetical protein